jgi:hypothetical protein
LGQALGGAQAADVSLVGIQGAVKRVENTQAAHHAEQRLNTHPTVAALQAADRVSVHTRAIGQLRLRETAKLAPPGEIASDLAKRPTNRRRHVGISWHMSDIICPSVGSMRL